MKWNRNNKYTILSLCYARDESHRRQLRKQEQDAAWARALRVLGELEARQSRGSVVNGADDDVEPCPT